MRVLGLMMVRDGGRALGRALDAMAEFCDSVCAIDDRSSDETAAILADHPIVDNVFSIDPALSSEPWFFPESMLLGALYRMADFYRPTWVILVEHDEVVTSRADIRSILEAQPATAVGVRFRRVSTWDDPDYPLMVPLMNGGTSMQAGAWRYRPGLEAGTKPLHNGRMPVNLAEAGEIADVTDVTFLHSGWDTLARRIQRVRFYESRDPEAAWNWGQPYDRSLLFGYRASELDQLIAEYHRRYARREHELEHAAQAAGSP